MSADTTQKGGNGTENGNEGTSTGDGRLDAPVRGIVAAGTLKAALDAVGTLVDEAKVRFNAAGLEIRAVDPANVGMCHVTLAAAAFESYSADDRVLGMNLGKLEDAVSFGGTDDLIHYWVDEQARKFHVEVDGLEYTFSLIDPSSIRQEPDLPDLDLAAEVVVEGRDLDRGVKACDMVADHIEFSVDADSEEFCLDASGDTDDARLVLAADDCVAMTAGDASSLFSLDYLQAMKKAIAKDAEVTVAVGDEFPVELAFDIAAGDGDVTYVLAPRIESN